MATRTQKRSSSRATVVCPFCAKRLSGEKGAVRHLIDVHKAAPEDIDPRYGFEVRHK